MIRAGIDIGSKSVKIVIMEDSKVLAKNSYLSGMKIEKFVKEAFEKLLRYNNMSKDDIKEVIATGVDVDLITFSTGKVNIITAIAKAANFFFPGEKLVVDIGAEETRVVKCDDQGNVKDFALNDKCAAGAGVFIEAISRALEIELEDMGPLALKTENTTPIDTQCVVFAESEVVSLVHRRVPKEEIARSVYDSMASRVNSMIIKLGMSPNIVLIGGMARDVGFIDCLKKKLKVDLLIPEQPEFASAIGVCL